MNKKQYQNIKSMPKNKPLLISGTAFIDRDIIEFENIEMIYLGTDVFEYPTLCFKLTQSGINKIKNEWRGYIVEFIEEIAHEKHGWILCWDLFGLDSDIENLKWSLVN